MSAEQAGLASLRRTLDDSASDLEPYFDLLESMSRLAFAESFWTIENTKNPGESDDNSGIRRSSSRLSRPLNRTDSEIANATGEPDSDSSVAKVDIERVRLPFNPDLRFGSERISPLLRKILPGEVVLVAPYVALEVMKIAEPDPRLIGASLASKKPGPEESEAPLSSRAE